MRTCPAGRNSAAKFGNVPTTSVRRLISCSGAPTDSSTSPAASARSGTRSIRAGHHALPRASRRSSGATGSASAPPRQTGRWLMSSTCGNGGRPRTSTKCSAPPRQHRIALNVRGFMPVPFALADKEGVVMPTVKLLIRPAHSTRTGARDSERTSPVKGTRPVRSRVALDVTRRISSRAGCDRRPHSQASPKTRPCRQHLRDGDLTRLSIRTVLR